MFVMGLVACIAAHGLFNKRPWSWWLVIVNGGIVAVNAFASGPAGVVVMVVATGLVAYLWSRPVRSAFACRQVLEREVPSGAVKGAGLALLVMFAAGVFQSVIPILWGSSFEISEPRSGSHASDPSVVVRGRADAGDEVLVYLFAGARDQVVTVADSDGNWSCNWYLHSGRMRSVVGRRETSATAPLRSTTKGPTSCPSRTAPTVALPLPHSRVTSIRGQRSPSVAGQLVEPPDVALAPGPDWVSGASSLQALTYASSAHQNL